LATEIAAALRDAAHIADYEALTDLIARIPVEHAGTALVLRALAERFDYDEIEARLQQGAGHHHAERCPA
jgi:hypothetical protein